ncbi:anti-CBASS protein Acb1 family protein [Xenorhabdus bovienii]|uniref:Putative Gp5 n=1 Tax=Xenorhabdus bovienii str. kraussei Becker Underwood TaxID=1398204 RepID=A0A077PYL5_XENBV|nr:anti-CBASS Acb1 family protein [Xenorhabdus bovienii]CDH24914.1 putative Gp5 [Xenorhabdus bovienii str. kraussei Becker Underwood]
MSEKQELLVNSLADTIAKRMLYAAGGISGNTKRTNIYSEFGYPEQLRFREYYNVYERNAVAHAAVHRLLDGCWQDNPTIIDGEEKKESDVTSAWETKVTKLLKPFWAKIKDADRRNMIGNYSALLIQVRDSKNWSEPVDVTVVSRLKVDALVNLIPVWEPQLTVAEWDQDIHSDTYGQPKMFNFDERPVGQVEMQGPAKQLLIHPSRVITLCEGAESGDIFSGTPLLRAGYNKLLDIEKVSGGSSEGFLKNASRQIGVEFEKETDMSSITTAAIQAGYEDLGAALEDKISKLNRGTDSAAVMQAGRLNVLSVAPGDPTPTWEVTAREFCASVQVPFTVLFGTQTGKLAGDKDDATWKVRLNGRRWGFLTQYVTQLITRLWEIGIIEPPSSGEVTIAWSDMLAASEKEKIDNMIKMAEAALKTQQAFGTPAFTPNEIRTVGELEQLKEEPEPQGATGDPLTDETDPNRNPDNTQK